VNGGSRNGKEAAGSSSDGVKICLRMAKQEDEDDEDDEDDDDGLFSCDCEENTNSKNIQKKKTRKCS
jgi:hypothetical protein